MVGAQSPQPKHPGLKATLAYTLCPVGARPLWASLELKYPGANLFLFPLGGRECGPGPLATAKVSLRMQGWSWAFHQLPLSAARASHPLLLPAQTSVPTDRPSTCLVVLPTHRDSNETSI